MEAMSIGLSWMPTVTEKIELDLYTYNLKNQGIYMGEINSLRQGTRDKQLLL